MMESMDESSLKKPVPPIPNESLSNWLSGALCLNALRHVQTWLHRALVLEKTRHVKGPHVPKIIRM